MCSENCNNKVNCCVPIEKLVEDENKNVYSLLKEFDYDVNEIIKIRNNNLMTSTDRDALVHSLITDCINLGININGAFITNLSLLGTICKCDLTLNTVCCITAKSSCKLLNIQIQMQNTLLKFIKYQIIKISNYFTNTNDKTQLFQQLNVMINNTGSQITNLYTVYDGIIQNNICDCSVNKCSKKCCLQICCATKNLRNNIYVLNNLNATVYAVITDLRTYVPTQSDISTIVTSLLLVSSKIVPILNQGYDTYNTIINA